MPHGLLAQYVPGPWAFFCLLMWIPLSAVFFSQHKPRQAAFIVMIWGTMMLPENVAVDPPILPPIDKHLLAGICAFVGIYLTAPKRFARMRALRGLQLFFFIFIIGNFGTAFSNPESYVWGGKQAWKDGPFYPIVVVPPLPKKEFIAMSIQDFFTYVVPFGVGQLLVQSREDAILFIKGITFGCLVYVPAMLWEGIMSPQLHNRLYGYHSVHFAHNIRGDGYKPVVFMKSGLGVAMFEFIGLAGAMTLMRLKEKVHPSIPAGMAALTIAFALAVSRNVAVVFYALGVLPVFLSSSPRMMARVAWVLAMIFMTFPITRAKGWFPADEIVAFATKYSEDRAGSLSFRFDNEDMLILHTAEKPYFGWGSYGRNRKYDPDTGKDISVTDGEWAIQYSVRGAVGAVGWFWMVGLPILWAARLIKKVIDPQDAVVIGAMALTAAINAADLLPNSSFTKIPFVFSGCLAGLLQAMVREKRVKA